MVELVVRGEHRDRPETDSQRKETLRDRVVPDTRRQKLLPRRGDEVQDTGDGTVQGDRSHEEHEEDNVRKYRQEVRGLAGTANAAYYHEEDRQPTEKKRDRETPVRHTDAVVDVSLLPQDFLASHQT